VIKASYANFGFVPYGHTMSGHLYYDNVADDFCTEIDEDSLIFSNELKALEQDERKERKGNIVTPFMIAARGGCTFVTKVSNMEEVGVAVGIVVDDAAEDVDDIIMSDDGSGAGIRIPSMLISKKDGDKLLDFLKTATPTELA
jgi:hypothetical protein